MTDLSDIPDLRCTIGDYLAVVAAHGDLEPLEVVKQLLEKKLEITITKKTPLSQVGKYIKKFHSDNSPLKFELVENLPDFAVWRVSQDFETFVEFALRDPVYGDLERVYALSASNNGLLDNKSFILAIEGLFICYTKVATPEKVESVEYKGMLYSELEKIKSGGSSFRDLPLGCMLPMISAVGESFFML